MADQKQTFNALTVFVAAAAVQFVVPSSLDWVLFPAVATYWFVSTKQESAVLDTVRSKSIDTFHVVHQKISTFLSAAKKIDDDDLKDE